MLNIVLYGYHHTLIKTCYNQGTTFLLTIKLQKFQYTSSFCWNRTKFETFQWFWRKITPGVCKLTKKNWWILCFFANYARICFLAKFCTWTLVATNFKSVCRISMFCAETKYFKVNKMLVCIFFFIFSSSLKVSKSKLEECFEEKGQLCGEERPAIDQMLIILCNSLEY